MRKPTPPTPPVPWPPASPDAGWRAFCDALSDAVIVFDENARVVLANTAALRLLPCEVGAPIDQLRPALGQAALRWLERAAVGSAPADASAQRVDLPSGRAVTLRRFPLDAGRWALQLAPEAEAPPAARAPLPTLDRRSLQEMIATFWESPFPALLQNTEFRLIDVNDAFLAFSGYTREQLVGRDPIDFQPEEDRAALLARRAALAADANRANDRALSEGRMLDASGRLRQYRVARRMLAADDGRFVLLAVLQDVTAEHIARERADHTVREIDDWFELSPVGMVLFDASGLLVRTNPAFDALAGAAPVSLVDAPAGLRELLAWGDAAAPEPGGAPVRREGVLTPADGALAGSARRLRSVVRCHETAYGQRRYMAIVEDRSIEEERDLAQVQVGALIDAAGVGIATFQESRGWVRSGAAASAGAGSAAAALEGIGRDLVLPESLPDFERLQAALREGRRAEVRYGIRHAELGERWLQTRIEPATLGSGQRTTSVVTLDVTAEHQNALRGERLQHALETAARDRERAEREVALQAERTRSILDSVLVGIVTVGPAGIEWMNRSARRMFGRELADFVDLPIATVAGDEPDHPLRRGYAAGELVEGEASTFECRLQARDGRVFWVVGNVVATERGAGQRQLTYALLDIERRRQAEARISEVQVSLQRILEAAPLAITLRDARTLRILQANEVSARIVHRRVEDLIGTTPEQLFPPEAAAARRADMEQALVSAAVTTREYRVDDGGEPRIWEARYLPLAVGPGHPPDQLLMVATDVTEQRAAQEARLEAAIAQREMLVREVHHRIKNNLQGVAGLMQQIAQRKPEIAGAIGEIVGQVQAIAQVYGMQVGASGPLRVVDLIEAITRSVQRMFGRPIRFGVASAVLDEWLLPEAEAIPIALTLNELLTNAIKHGVVPRDAAADADAADVECTLERHGAGLRVRIVNPGRLADDFRLERLPGSVSGLGLVRALLPRRHARLTIEQTGAQVTAAVLLEPPVVELPAPSP